MKLRLSATPTTAIPKKAISTKKITRYTIQKHLVGYLFLLPALLIFGLFVWYPIILGFLLSFQEIDLSYNGQWIGLKNYDYVFSDPLFATAWRNTFAFTGYSLLFGYIIPIVLAIAINEMRHGKGFFRLAFYLPVILPPIVTVFLWRWIYNPDSGLLNALLSLFGQPPMLWLENASIALPALVVIATWCGAGSTLLIYIAALQGVSASLYEASEIDGANFWRKLWHITIPQIRGVMLFMLILQIINTMQVFTEPFTITGGGPQNATLTVLLLIYNYAFQDANFGAASALGILLFIILVFFGAIYSWTTRRFAEGV